MGPVELKYVPVAVFVRNAQWFQRGPVVSRILVAVQKSGDAIGFSHAYNVAKCSQNEMRARGQGNRDVQSQFTFANT